MNLLIKSAAVLFLLLNGPFGFTQETTTQHAYPKDDHYGIIKIGVQVPFAFGNNFANKGLSTGGGMSYEIAFNLFDEPYLLGLHYSFSVKKVKHPELVGDYSSTNISVIGPLLGYQFFDREKIRLTLTGGFGYLKYNNKTGGIKFHDDGTTVWVSPEISYHFVQKIGVYASPVLRKDFLNTNAPPGYQSFFETTNYLNLNVGIRFIF